MQKKSLPYKLSIVILLLFSLLLPSCGRDSIPTALEVPEETQEDVPTSSSVILASTEDRGEDYLDSFIFFGESTTYHLKSRGVLKGGSDTKQVWAPDSGTCILDSTITTLRIRYPDTGEALTVREAAERKQPEYLVLTFGLNGAVGHVTRGDAAFKSAYRALISSVLEVSPNTKIILQSCFPVASNMDMSAYSITLDDLNKYIVCLNGWTLELAEEMNLRYLNTAEILTDEDGRLREEYQVGDGHHLTRQAYVKILNYIRTHGYS